MHYCDPVIRFRRSDVESAVGRSKINRQRKPVGSPACTKVLYVFRNTSGVYNTISSVLSLLSSFSSLVCFLASFFLLTSLVSVHALFAHLPSLLSLIISRSAMGRAARTG